ncbi:MAG: dephospho-CoA kinase [Bacteroidales bacterium]|jgi:dephospho-CoA kinase|nr:dephospho-CoA kinase [Bacteroidales bacterium]
MKLGLTGSIGSGKSTVAKLFEMMGVPVFYSDVVAAKLYFEKKIQQIIIKHFGDGILFDQRNAEIEVIRDVHIDKTKLSNIVFNNPSELQWLNHLIHPLVKKKFDCWAKQKEKTGCKTVIFESAIIFENNLENWFDKIISVYAPEALAVERAVARNDFLTQEDIVQRMKNQISADKKREKADFVIVNDEKKSVIEQVFTLWHDFCGELE